MVTGFGGCLYAETTTGLHLTGEAVSKGKGTIAEELGKEAAYRLLEEVRPIMFSNLFFFNVSYYMKYDYDKVI